MNMVIIYCTIHAQMYVCIQTFTFIHSAEVFFIKATHKSKHTHLN